MQNLVVSLVEMFHTVFIDGSLDSLEWKASEKAWGRKVPRWSKIFR